MIKAGIAGAQTPMAGELLRILIHHPEVDLKVLYASGMNGRNVTTCHHGFIGEDVPVISDRLDPNSLDVIFLTEDSAIGREIVGNPQKWEELRVIDLSPGRFDNWDAADMEYGLSEINRKGLVRGATRSIIPTSAAALSLIALYPLATYLLLPSSLKIEVTAPKDVVEHLSSEKIEKEVARQLKKAQNSFGGNISYSFVANKSGRVMRLKCIMDCSLPLEEIEKIYQGIYDDHNFNI